MILDELFKQDTSFQHDVQQGDHEWAATSTLESGKVLTVSAKIAPLTEDNPVWDVDFKVGREYDKTGDGNEFEVFQRVISLLNEFVESKNPQAITMSSAGANRTRLYLRMFKRVLPGWKVVVAGADTSLISLAKGDSLPVFYDAERQAAWCWFGDIPVGRYHTIRDLGGERALQSMIDIDKFKDKLQTGNLDTERQEIEKLYLSFDREAV